LPRKPPLLRLLELQLKRKKPPRLPKKLKKRKLPRRPKRKKPLKRPKKRQQLLLTQFQRKNLNNLWGTKMRRRKLKNQLRKLQEKPFYLKLRRLS
jgi:hypothetical protein